MFCKKYKVKKNNNILYNQVIGCHKIGYKEKIKRSLAKKCSNESHCLGKRNLENCEQL